MKFLNRIREIDRLLKGTDHSHGRLKVLYGRRRLGKTRLLQQIRTGSDIFFVADQREKPLQIAAMAKVIAEHIPAFDQVDYPDWDSILTNLIHRWQHGRFLIIDEFPYLVKNAPELTSLLQKLFDQQPPVSFHLIICGSSQQMMQQIIIDPSAPLYGRADEIIRLKPMNIYWLQQALQVPSVEAVEEYSVWGGVPRYWEIRMKGNNLKEALIGQVLDVQGILYDEPGRLFLDDTRDTIQISTLLSVIANGAQRLSAIASQVGKPATSLNRPLQKLIELGYIKKEIPFGESRKNSKKSLYRLADPFIHFYYRYVVTSKTALEAGYSDQIYDYQVQNTFSEHVAYWWEDLCREAVPALFKDTFYYPAQRWWGANKNKQPMEVDIVSESYDGKTLLIGEAKWSGSFNIKSLIHELNQKADSFPLGKDYKIQKALFLKKPYHNIPSDIQIFTPNRIIKTFNK